MPTIDLGAVRTPPAPTGLLAGLPRRVTLTLAELRLVAAYAGSAPLPFDIAPRDGDSGLDARLGGPRATEDAAAYDAALDALHEPDAALSRRGLLVDEAVDDGLLGAVALLATPSVALDLDVAAGPTRIRAWHRQGRGAVAALTTADGIVFELAWFAADLWGDELARAAVLPEELGTADSAVTDGIELPYELIDAAAEAMGTGRFDLVSTLVAQHTGHGRAADGTALPDSDVLTSLQALTTECRGRLRALVADVSGERTDKVGVVSWVLLADGWRALRPRSVDGDDRVTITRVSPADLATELVPVLGAVVR